MILQTSSINYKRSRLRFVQGRPVRRADSADEIDSTDMYFLTSDPIPGGQHFYIRVKDGYKLAYVIFFDRDMRKYLSYEGWRYWITSLITPAAGLVIRDNVSVESATSRPTWIPSECYVRVVVCREETVLESAYGPVLDGAELTPSDDFVDKFRLFDNVLLQRRRAYTPTFYKQGMFAARQVNAVYAPVRVQPKRYATDATGPSGSDTTSVCHGVPYSATPQLGGQVNYGQTGIETYLSAWGNRRSLMYTDYPKQSISEYGITYLREQHVVANGYYAYGMVCNDAVSTVLGLAARCDETMWGNLSTVLYSTPQSMLDDNGAKLRSFDIVMTSPNHVFVITDIFEDEDGELFFEIFESSGPCRFFLLTLQRLFYKTTHDGTRKYVFYRLNNSYLNKTGNLLGRFYHNFAPVPGLPTEVRKRVPRYVPNDDISTFLGNKVTIAAGDMLWLNVRQYNGTTRETFTHLKFKRYYAALQMYVLADTVEMVQPAAGHVNTFSDGDVVWDIDVSARFASRPQDLDGPHTGLWQVTAYSPATGRESEPVEFEVLDFALLSAKSGYNKGMTLVAFDLPSSLRDGRHVFFRPMMADTEPLHNNYMTAWTDLAPGDGMVVLCTLAATGTRKIRMNVKGVYNYCHKDIETVDVYDYAHLGNTTEEGNKAINTDGTIASSGTTAVYTFPATGLRGSRLTAVYRDVSSGGNGWGYRAAQYDENGDFIPGTVVTIRPANSPAGDGSTRFVSLGEIAANCATMKFTLTHAEARTFGIFLESNTAVPTQSGIKPIGDNGNIEF